MKLEDIKDTLSFGNIKHIEPILKQELLNDPEVGPYVNDISKYQSILINDTIQIGTIRIDPNNKLGSLFISPRFQGKGFATKAIIKSNTNHTLISPDNIASKKAFAKAGFKFSKTKEIQGDTVQVWAK